MLQRPQRAERIERVVVDRDGLQLQPFQVLQRLQRLQRLGREALEAVGVTRDRQAGPPLTLFAARRIEHRREADSSAVNEPRG